MFFFPLPFFVLQIFEDILVRLGCLKIYTLKNEELLQSHNFFVPVEITFDKVSTKIEICLLGMRRADKGKKTTSAHKKLRLK